MKQNFKLQMYDKVKYEPDSKIILEKVYTDVTRVLICKLPKEVYHTLKQEVDENEEYVIFRFADGRSATFRNSHVDVCRA